MFVDLGLPLNIYVFNQLTARFKVGLGEVRGQGEIPQLCSGGDWSPTPALLLEPRKVSLGVLFAPLVRSKPSSVA